MTMAAPIRANFLGRSMTICLQIRPQSPLSALRRLTLQHSIRYSSNVQSITQPSFWAGMVPKPLRKGAAASRKPRTTEWNPATFFIVIFLFIGSMSIQMIALRKDFAAFSRRADAKLELLREIIEKIQKGEEVDVEGLLGTGNPEKEKEWEEVLREIEEEDHLWTNSQQRKPQRSTIEQSTELQNNALEAQGRSRKSGTEKHKVKSKAPPGFY